MPTYDFLCRRGHRHEWFGMMTAAPQSRKCPACGLRAVRQLGAGVTMTHNSGNPDVQAAFTNERRFATMSSQSPNARLGIDPAEGTVRRGKQPRDKRKIRVVVP